MLMLREGAAKAHRRTLVESLRIQLLLSLVFAVLAPALLYPDLTPERVGFQALINSMIGAAIGVLIGLVLVRRVTAFPGSRAFGFVLPSFATAYASVVTFFFAFRLDYGRLYLSVSFASALLVAYLVNFWLERYVVPRFHVVPFGETDQILDIPDVEWIIMADPEVPDDHKAALVADLRFEHDAVWERMLAEAAVGGHPVYHVKQLRESLTGRVSMEHLSENSFGSLLPNLAYVKVKRAIDLLTCFLLLPLLFIPVLLIACLIKLDTRGPAFFKQERMGYRGRPFSMMKFRTMHLRPLSADEEVARRDAMTQSEDTRITRVGRFLRRSRLDELPQIVNVLRGEMSLIGPRPEAIALSRWYEAELPFYFYRHIVRPGISGWAQVHQGHVTDLDAVNQKLNYDFFYIKNFSSWLDILIAFKTIPTMLTGNGSK